MIEVRSPRRPFHMNLSESLLSFVYLTYIDYYNEDPKQISINPKKD